MQEFDRLTCEKIGYYVYALIDPRDQKPFYVGKGVDNRVFAHANEAIETGNESEKLDLVRAIRLGGNNVQHVILRHGLDEKTALAVESTLLDFASYFSVELTNLVLGHHSSTFGTMTTDELIRKYNAPPLERLGNDCVIININRRYREAKQQLSFYEATKESWVMANPEKKDLSYVLAEYQSIVVEVFQVEKWYQVNDRWGFDGQVAPDEIRNLYFNRKIYKKRGSANPISYRLQVPNN